MSSSDPHSDYIAFTTYAIILALSAIITNSIFRKEERTAVRNKHINLSRNNSESRKAKEQREKLQKANGKIQKSWSLCRIWLIRVSSHISEVAGKHCENTVQILGVCNVNCGHY